MLASFTQINNPDSPDLDGSELSLSNDSAALDAHHEDATIPLHSSDAKAEEASDEQPVVAQDAADQGDSAAPAQQTSWFSAVGAGLWAGAAYVGNAAVGAVQTTAAVVQTTATTIAEKVVPQAAKNDDTVKEKKSSPIADENLKVAAKLKEEINEDLRRLEISICDITGDKPTLTEAGNLKPVELSTWKNIQNYGARAQGATSALGGAAMGVAGGAAVAGVGYTGILGLGGGVAAFGGGTMVALESIRQFPDRAENAAILIIIKRDLPAIEAKAVRLNALAAQEQHRQEVGQRLVTTLVERRDHCLAMIDTVKSLEQQAYKLTGSLDDLTARSLQSNDSRRNVISQKIEQAGQALYSLMTSIVQTIKDVGAWIIPSAESRQANANRNAEEEFKKIHATMLERLADEKGSTISPSTSVNALINMTRDAGETSATRTTVVADIRAGENLTRSIFASDINFGIIKHTAGTGDSAKDYAVPSNLTTVRSIASYINAQAIENKSNPANSATAVATVVEAEDGSYTIADPDRKLYSFLASAPTAQMNAVEKGASVNVADRVIGRMTITDYSRTMPGGTDQLIFEPQMDKNGATVLTMRFAKLDPQPSSTAYQAPSLKTIVEEQKNIYLNQPNAAASIPANMTQTEIWNKIDEIMLVCDQQLKLYEQDKRQLEALEKWVNPIDTQKK